MRNSSFDCLECDEKIALVDSIADSEAHFADRGSC
ncbi:MAG: hypothetical protein ACI9CV_001586 [Ilumatobacter sp.]|jgi:hypothetical protein